MNLTLSALLSTVLKTAKYHCYYIGAPHILHHSFVSLPRKVFSMKIMMNIFGSLTSVPA